MNDNNSQAPEPGDIPNEKAPEKGGEKWNFKGTNHSRESGADNGLSDDVFDSLDDTSTPALETDQQRISEIQRQGEEKRRAILAESKKIPEFSKDAADSPASAEPPDEATSTEDSTKSEAANEPPKKKELNLKFIEVVLIGIFLVVVSAGLIWIGKEVFSFPRGSQGLKPATMPAQGNYAKVVEIDDFWRQPITTGENPDKPQLGMKLIPVVELTLGSESKSGVLRFFFRDPDGNIVGDPRAVEFENGNFTLNNSPTIEVSSTTGFSNAADFNRYKYEDLNFWTVDVLEGKRGQDTSEFKLLFKHDISATLSGELDLELYE